MSDRIPTGAYVIRNKAQRSLVLHVENGDATKESSPVLAFEQDEGQYNNQQIWWVEPFSNYEDNEPEKGPVYSITSPSSGRSLDVGPKAEDIASNICAFTHHGEPWQRWRLRKVNDDKGGSYYTIASVFSGRVVDIHNGRSVGSNYELHSQTYVSGYDQHCWEFIIPVVGFPPGWFQIQNVGTGDLLSQTYVYNPPILLPPPESPRPSQYREDWGFQWALSHAKFHNAHPSLGRNSWCIVNRLTRRLLTSFPGNQTCSTLKDADSSRTWKLELDPSCNWKIISIRTSCLLEQSTIARGGGTAIICDSQRPSPKGGSKSWILRPPVLETVDGSPPGYEADSTTTEACSG